jgi:glutamine amidotransferase
MNADVLLVDYGSGNLASIRSAVHAVGYSTGVAQNPAQVAQSELVILPGVGNAESAEQIIRETWLAEALHLRNENCLPTVGICLGAQLMYEWLEESQSAGLLWLAGSVQRLPHGSHNTGWYSVDYEALSEVGLAKGLRPSDTVYFNHRFELPRNQALREVLSVGPREVVAIANLDHLYAIQFHPEKSQAAGVRFLKNVLEAARVR